MSRSGTWRLRSRTDWAGRIALACGFAVFAFHSVAFSIAQVAAKANPALAHMIAPYDGRLAAAHAAALTTPTATAVERARAESLAREALRRDPTTVLGAVMLGLGMAAHGDEAAARRLLTYAQMLSRRNVQTQLWSIEDASARGDVPGALRWYDIALRTKPRMKDMLYPALMQVMRDPATRAALVRTLAGRPVWADSYIRYAIAQKGDPHSTAALFLALHDHGIAVSGSAEASAVNALLDTGNVDEAWRYYTVIRPGADRRRSRDPRFAAMLETPSLFDWTALNDGGIVTSIQRSPDGGTFEFSAPASIGGPLLQQVQLLPPGRYRLLGHSSGIDQDARALPYWSLTCRSNGQELDRVVVPDSAQAGGMFAGNLTVSANCLVQVLTLFAQPSDAIGGMSGQIDRLTLTPTGQTPG